MFNDELWTSFNLNLSQIKTSKAVRLRFEHLSSENVPFYLDNINIHDESSYLQSITYPNPSSNIVYLDLKHEGNQEKSIKVYSNLGVPLATFYLGSSYSSIEEIDFSNFAAGLYILKIYVGSDVLTQKVILTN